MKPIIGGLFKKIRPQLSFGSDIISEFGINKILILRQDRIGDLIISQPIFKQIKTKYPSVQLDVLLSNYNKSASNCISQYVNSIFVYDKSLTKSISLIKMLKKQKYDLVIDLMDKSSSTSALLIKYINPKYSAGLDKENSDIYNFVVTRLDDKEFHIIERTAQVLALFGISTESIDLRPVYNLAQDYKPYPIAELIREHRKYIAINLSGSNASKFWGVENIIKFINLFTLHFPDYVAVLVFTKDYDNVAKQIADASPALQCDLLNSFDEYVYVLSKASIILSPDSSAVHIASAFNITSIVLYNQDINRADITLPWFPYKSDCFAFGTTTSNIKDILPETVINAIKDEID